MHTRHKKPHRDLHEEKAPKISIFIKNSVNETHCNKTPIKKDEEKQDVASCCGKFFRKLICG